jgi:hypothetical protein
MEKMAFFSRGKQSREEQFLLNVFCLSIEAGSDYREQLRNSFFALDEERLWQLSLDCKVTAVFAHRLADLFGWENITPRWREFHDQMTGLVNLYCDEIDFVARELSGYGIKVIALKNNAIALAFHLCRGCCPMSDADILIDGANQQQAATVLKKLGYKHTWDSSNTSDKTGANTYHKIAPSGQFIFLDVHWEAIGVRWLSGDLGELTSKMVESACPIPGTTARMLSPEDNLFQVVLHDAKHAYRPKPGLMRNLDVHRIIENQEINWTVFLNLIHTHKINTAAYFSLLAPAILFGTPVPEEVLGAIAPPSWKKPLFQFVRSTRFLNPNKNKLRSFIFRIIRVIMYDDIKILILNSFNSAWRKRRKWRAFYLLQSKIVDLLSKRKKSFATFPIVFHGPGSYKKIFKGRGYGVVFEDDGQEGYVYAIKEDGSKIFDALKLYDQGDTEKISEGDLLKILWHPKLKKVGVMYHEKIQAIFDIAKKESCSRTGFPLPNASWCKSKNHLWDDSALSGFEAVS